MKRHSKDVRASVFDEIDDSTKNTTKQVNKLQITTNYKIMTSSNLERSDQAADAKFNTRQTMAEQGRP